MAEYGIKTSYARYTFQPAQVSPYSGPESNAASAEPKVSGGILHVLRKPGREPIDAFQDSNLMERTIGGALAKKGVSMFRTWDKDDGGGKTFENFARMSQNSPNASPYRLVPDRTINNQTLATIVHEVMGKLEKDYGLTNTRAPAAANSDTAPANPSGANSPTEPRPGMEVEPQRGGTRPARDPDPSNRPKPAGPRQF